LDIAQGLCEAERVMPKKTAQATIRQHCEAAGKSRSTVGQFGRCRHPNEVGSANWADRTAGVPPASDVDHCSKTVSGCFGEEPCLSGCGPICSCTSKPVTGTAIS
jgi:hypothetical protein